MSTLLIKNTNTLVTMDDQRREITDGGLFIRDGKIEQVGVSSELPDEADEVLDLSDHILLPVLINTHHHFYQTLTRSVPAARQAMLIVRLGSALGGSSLSSDNRLALMTARQVLEIATRGGEDIGSLEPGKCADFLAINLNCLEYAGALHDPVAEVLLCAPVHVDHNVVGGKFVVKEGQVITLDCPKLIEEHNQAARKLLLN